MTATVTLETEAQSPSRPALRQLHLTVSVISVINCRKEALGTLIVGRVSQLTTLFSSLSLD